MLLTLDSPAGTLLVTDDDVFDKTQRGRDEVRTRASGLNQRARSILIMVDGVRTVGDLRAAMARLSAPEDTLDTLLTQELIVQTRIAQGPALSSRATPRPAPLDDEEPFVVAAVNDPERFRVAKKFMNDTAVDALGLRAFMFTLRLEKCGNLADLAEIAPEYVRLLVKARGAEIAHALRTRLREMLS